MESRRDTAVRELMHEYKKLDNSHPNKKELRLALEGELMLKYPNSSKPEMLDQWIKSELDREIIQQAENILSGSFEGSLREELLTLFIEKLDTL
tara:strand:+ start:237 stop:518 length:282 start_codon:yes stop_codon:yes gene_type:complete